MSFGNARPRSQTMSGGTPGRGSGSPGSCSSSSSSSTSLILSIEMRLDSVIGCLYETSGRWRELQRVTVRYDVDCPEYNTVHGVYRSTPTASSDSTSLTPVEMLVRGIDKLLEGLPSALMPSVGAISLSAMPSLPIFLATGSQMSLQTLSPAAQLCSLCTYPSFFTIPFSPNSQDYTSGAEVRAILESIGGVHTATPTRPREGDATVDAADDVLERESRRAGVARAEETVARRTGAGLSPGVCGMPAQILKIRQGRAVGFAGDEGSGLQAAWARTARIVSPGMLLEALLTGRVPSMHNIDAALTGLCEPRSGRWDLSLTEVISGGPTEALRAMLGGVETFGRQQAASVSAWMVQRFGFRQDCAVFPALPTPVAAFLSFLPGKGDAGLAQGLSDLAIIPSNALVTDHKHISVPHPLADLDSGSPSWLNLAPLPGAGEARKLVRDGYFHGSWRGYQRLVAALPIGGMASMDNKLFSLYSAYGPLRGLRRYEHGVIVGEFSDLRANARCLVESQSFTVRAMAGCIAAADRALDPKAFACDEADDELLKERRRNVKAPIEATPPHHDSSTLPLRWFAWGDRVCGASAEVVAVVTGGCVVATEEEALCCEEEEEVGETDGQRGTDSTATPITGSSPRAALGAAFVALWLSTYRSSGESVTATFAETMRRHLRGEVECPSGSDRLSVMGLATLHQPPRRRPRSLTATAAMIQRSASLSMVSEQVEQAEGTEPEQGDVTPRARVIEVESQPGDDERWNTTCNGDATWPRIVVNGEGEEGRQADGRPCKEEQERVKADDERERGLVRLALPDRHLFSVYAALFEEHLRLTELLERAEARAAVGLPK